LFIVYSAIEYARCTESTMSSKADPIVSPAGWVAAWESYEPSSISPLQECKGSKAHKEYDEREGPLERSASAIGRNVKNSFNEIHHPLPSWLI